MIVQSAVIQSASNRWHHSNNNKSSVITVSCK